jgi:hypothetical protein
MMGKHLLLGRGARWTAGAALAAVVVSGCGSGSGSDPDSRRDIGRSASSTSPSPGAPPTGSAPGTVSEPPADFAAAPVEVASPESGQLVSVTPDSTDGVDRLVFTFAGEAPGFRVEEVDRVTTGGRNDPEGDVVDVAGQSYLSVRFTSTTPNTDGAISEDVPSNADLDLPLLRQVMVVHNVGGTLRFGVGVGTADLVFRVVPQQDPTRLVVEVKAA